MPNDSHDPSEDNFEDDFEPEPTSQEPLSLMTDRLHLLATRKEEMWWEIGLLLDELALRGLVLPHGFDDFAAFAQAELGLTKAEAIQFRRVAHHFSRETALRFGAPRLDLLLQYLEATPRTQCAVDVLRVEILLRKEEGEVAVPFPEISEEELVRAVRSAKRRRTTTDPAVPADVAAERDRLADAIAAEVPGGHVKVKVHLLVGVGDVYSLSLTGIDPFNMAAVGKVVLEEGEALEKATEDR
jgi:hypothetical protein